ncbi:MAG: hypothetical protein C4293_15605 [Nitrospiraceae bacterium]
MCLALITCSFLPFATRFLYRHPTKLRLLRQHWADDKGRFGKVAALIGKDANLVEETFYELECKEPLFREPKEWAGMPMHAMIYYVLVRLMQPEIVVETGVCEGLSSRLLLRAMERNGRGVLHSIDLPNGNEELGPGKGRQINFLPQGKETGWMVPNHLRTRRRLYLGDAKELLPKVLLEVGAIDMFIHDSLHSYEHMLFFRNFRQE